MWIEDASENLQLSGDMDVVCVKADGTSAGKSSQIVLEHDMDLYIDGQRAARLVCTPTNLPEMVLGRLITSRLIDSVDAVEDIVICRTGHTVHVRTRRDTENHQGQPLQKEGNQPLQNGTDLHLVEALQKEPTCCPDNKVFVVNQDARDLRPLAPAAWTPEDIFLLAGRFSKGSGIHKKTQGTHSAYLYHGGRIIFSAEDIGRHNAMDKVIGHMLLHELDPGTCMVYTTGRVPTDMVEKAIAAGIPVLVTKAVPTDQAVEMAKKYNLTLICKAWPDSFEVFHNSCRMEG